VADADGVRLAPFALVFAAALVLAGCAAPSQFPEGGPPDPGSDVAGWEAGYWHNESVDVDQSDGLNESEQRAVVRRAMARIEYVRDVEFREPVTVETLSRAEYRERVLGGGGSGSQDGSGGGDGSVSNATLMSNARYEALFLVGEGRDSEREQRETQASQVLGFYSPREDRIVLIAETETPTISEATLAHELVHAFQFRHLNPQYNGSTLEAKNSHLGLIEGDARYTEHLYMERCGVEWACVAPEAASETGGDSDADSDSGDGGPHRGIALLNYFPYSDGSVFVRALKEEGGWEAVNEAYRAYPASSEQVVFPAKYREDAPTQVSLRDRSGPDWRRVRPPGPDYAAFGMAGITAMFAYPSYEQSRGEGVIPPQTFLNVGPDGRVDGLDPIEYGIDYAAGWDGDRLHAYYNPESEELGYVWRLAWDSPGEAEEFAAGYRELLRYWGAERVRRGVWRIPEGESAFADAFAVRVEGDTVTIVNAPSADALDGVYAGSGAGGD
jgi:hypothetical protein